MITLEEMMKPHRYLKVGKVLSNNIQACKEQQKARLYRKLEKRTYGYPYGSSHFQRRDLSRKRSSLL